MMVVYNLTNIMNFSGGFGDLVKVANDGSSGFLVGLFMLGLWLVLLFAFLRFGDFTRALGTASFLGFLMSTFLVAAGLLNIIYLLAFLFLTAVAIFLLYMGEE